jgi:hypothetical protein
MMKEPTALEAKKYLTPVFPEWKAFWFNKGPVVKSLKEMASVMANVPPMMFSYHVSAAKNDLAAWVKDAIGDAELARELKEAGTVKAAAALLEKRVKQLDKSLVVVPPATKKKK